MMGDFACIFIKGLFNVYYQQLILSFEVYFNWEVFISFHTTFLCEMIPKH